MHASSAVNLALAIYQCRTAKLRVEGELAGVLHAMPEWTASVVAAGVVLATPLATEVYRCDRLPLLLPR